MRNTWKMYWLQKTYTTNLFEGKHKKNNGEVTRYYIKNHHPAIVSREMFQLAQEELARRNSKKTGCTEKGKRRTADGSPANTLYRKDWFAEAAAAITGELTWDIHGKETGASGGVINRAEFGKLILRRFPEYPGRGPAPSDIGSDPILGSEPSERYDSQSGKRSAG